MIARLKLFVLYFSLWIIVSEGKIEIFPTLFILAFSIVTPYVFTLNYKKISLKALLRLSFWFLLYSLKGGLQVALFALKPKLALAPFIYTHQLRVQSSFSISLLANIYSLMPGTLSIAQSDATLQLHVLDKSLFEIALIERFESYVLETFEEESL